MVIYLIQSLASPHYGAVLAPFAMRPRKWLARVALTVGAPPGATGIDQQIVAGVKKRRKMNLLIQKLIAPLFLKNSKLNE